MKRGEGKKRKENKISIVNHSLLSGCQQVYVKWVIHNWKHFCSNLQDIQCSNKLMSWGLNSMIAIRCQLSAGFMHFVFLVSVHLNYLQPANEGLCSQSYGFPNSHVWIWELDYKESWVPKNWCFWTVCWRRHLRVPWTARRSSQAILKEINPEYSMERLMMKLKHQ